MRKICALLLILALFIVPIISASGNIALADEGKIIVCGEGEISLIPDMAIVSVGVESLNDSLINAQTENTQSMNALISILKEMGISEDCIKTKGYNVYQRYDYTEGEKLLGYQVSNYLEFKTKDVDNIGSIISKLMENGANRFSGVTFTLENSEEAYKSALSQAFENAKSKAMALYNGELKVVKITEEKNLSYYLKDSYGYANSISEATKFMKGEIKVCARIIVVFEYNGEIGNDTLPEHIEPENNDTLDKETGDKETGDKETGEEDTNNNGIPNNDEIPNNDPIIQESLDENINNNDKENNNLDENKDKELDNKENNRYILGNSFNKKTCKLI